MPRFFFHLHNDVDVPDHEGIVLPDAEAARERGLLNAREMICEEVRQGRVDLSHFIAIEDEAGRLTKVFFRDAVSIHD